MFEGIIPNYRYKVIRSNNTPYEFTIVDFPLMNLNDLITQAKIMGYLDNDHISNKATYIIGYGHINNFIDCYFAYLGLTGFEMVKS